MSYLYETHLHTVYASSCGISKGSDYIRLYKEMGYTGIIVTDHFYNGNTAVSRSLSWNDWVTEFCKGYEEARNEGERRGIDVFFGWEETFDGGDDYLIYGLDKQWLFDHPEVKNWTRGEQYRAVKAGGGCVVQAHPFRQHSHIRRVLLSTGCVDAVEAANACNAEQSYDGLAMRYAQKLGLPVTAGSDIHDARNVCNGWVFGVFTEKRLKNIGDFVDAVCHNGISGLSASAGRCDYFGDETVRLPVEIRDSDDKSIGSDWKKLLT